MTLASLLASLAAAPSLPDASCRGLWDTFDPGRQEDTEALHERHRTALRVCERCPELAPCRAWLDGLPKTERPLGVVAGRRFVTGRTGWVEAPL